MEYFERLPFHSMKKETIQRLLSKQPKLSKAEIEKLQREKAAIEARLRKIHEEFANSYRPLVFFVERNGTDGDLGIAS
jgi:DNA helicase IV